MVYGEWLIDDNEGFMVDGLWLMVNGEWLMGNGLWFMIDCEWFMVDGWGWLVDGWWLMAYGLWVDLLNSLELVALRGDGHSDVVVVVSVLQEAAILQARWLIETMYFG